ncbi:MAG TPA: cellulose biosynthesis protein BcsQ [Rhodopila sp.]|uniref:cellulose biosynthesis protein BcsQ n=1 Tax=Rhodopila sp. TaxID=2480087 RepID=UPI002CADDEDD|nr:cellulose biosynthesis protein BcsQ [Rhodopila sp.]HVY13838.1 cellulose biosynthesis protein BcsQ [Rhodopila sp.]
MTMICFTSPKGGVGKTTLAANIAGELSRAGFPVVALDLDPQNTLRLHFGVPLERDAGFSRLIAQQPNWRDYVVETPSGVSLLPYGAAGMRETVDLGAAIASHPEILLRALDPLLMTPGICLVVDTPPGPSPMLAALLPRINLMIIVLTTDPSSASVIPTLEDGRIASEQEQVPPDAIRFILNQFDPRTRLGSVIGDATSKRLGDRLLGLVYRDEHVVEAIAAQKLLSDYAPGSKACQDISAIGQTLSTYLRAVMAI